MLYATYAKVSREMIKQDVFIRAYLKSVLRPEKKTGFKFILHGNLRSYDQHADNFVNNTITFVQEYMMYKKPRFIK